MERRPQVSYELVPVDVPPIRTAKTRVTAWERQLLKAAQSPGQWFKIATYNSRTGAYQARRRIERRAELPKGDPKAWPWPVVAVENVTSETTSELYVKVVDIHG